MEYLGINGFNDYRLVRESERDFRVESKKRGEWEEIGSDDGYGHINVNIYVDGYRKHTSVHVLVAEMFVPNPEGKTHVHHIDFDATNNDPANLLWVTPSQHKSIHNELDNPMKGKHHTKETRRKLSEKMKGGGNPMYGKHHTDEAIKKMSKPVEQWSLDGTTLIARYASTMEAERQTNINHRNISACCNGKRHSAGGYKWRYAD